MTQSVVDEGVTKFELVHLPAAPLPVQRLAALIEWRMLLRRLELIGQVPGRYGGVGFGNVSQRLPARRGIRFVVSGTQTGALPKLDASHFAVVTGFNVSRNRIESEGQTSPSSESLTHAMLYALAPTIRFVFHVHSPEIWRRSEDLRLARTADDAPYGTPAMAREMKRLYGRGAFARRPVIVMGGHEDGVVAVGRSADQAGLALLRAYAQAISLGR